MTNTHITIGGHKVSAGKVYSTSEVKTGDVWIDGKPIYRKVITDTITIYNDSGTRRTFTWNDTYFTDKTLVRVYGTYKYNGTTVLSMGCGYQTASNTINYSDAVQLYNNTLSLLFFSTVSTGFTKVEIVVVVEYTKTTD